VGETSRAEAAREHIFGYSVFNDFSARDTQAIEMPMGMGVQKSKGFRRFERTGSVHRHG
jgi:2-keto-4-pentenoate hydratase/2-oxohepta-3-ene-1,7-dioic acid hydratase in catechol pathway